MATKQTNDAFSVASYNHRSKPFMVIEKLLFSETAAFRNNAKYHES